MRINIKKTNFSRYDMQDFATFAIKRVVLCIKRKRNEEVFICFCSDDGDGCLW